MDMQTATDGSAVAEGRQMGLTDLRNMGTRILADLRRLGISSVGDLAGQDPDDMYLRLCRMSGTAVDPRIHDVLSAIVHQSRTGEPRNWWAYTQARKARMYRGDFPRFREAS